MPPVPGVNAEHSERRVRQGIDSWIGHDDRLEDAVIRRVRLIDESAKVMQGRSRRDMGPVPDPEKRAFMRQQLPELVKKAIIDFDVPLSEFMLPFRISFWRYVDRLIVEQYSILNQNSTDFQLGRDRSPRIWSELTTTRGVGPPRIVKEELWASAWEAYENAPEMTAATMGLIFADPTNFITKKEAQDHNLPWDQITSEDCSALGNGEDYRNLDHWQKFIPWIQRAAEQNPDN